MFMQYNSLYLVWFQLIQFENDDVRFAPNFPNTSVTERRESIEFARMSRGRRCGTMSARSLKGKMDTTVKCRRRSFSAIDQEVHRFEAFEFVPVTDDCFCIAPSNCVIVTGMFVFC